MQIILCGIVVFSQSVVLANPVRVKKMKLSVDEVRALSSAYTHPAIREIAVDKYDIYIEESDVLFYILFVAKDKQKSYRGSMPGLPEPSFEVEKDTGKIVKFYYTR